MATFEKREGRNVDISWRARVRVRGQARTKSFKRKTDAKAWAEGVEHRLRYGRYVPDEAALRRTVGDLIDRYVDRLPRKPKNRDSASVKRMLGEWKVAIGTVPVPQCTSELVVEIRDQLAVRAHSRAKRPLSPATVNRYLARLSHVFTVAVKEWGWAENNPVRRVSRLEEPGGRTRFLDATERAALLKACKTSPCAYLYPVVVLALSTGARRNEILSLTWRQIDFARGQIALEQTKNGECRVLPLTGHAYDEIAGLFEGRRPDSEFVFPGVTGNRPRDIQTSWQAALKEAQVVNFRFHDLRHSAASYLAMNGATLAEIAEILGHKSYEMVKRYSHLVDAHTATVVARMNRGP